MKDDAKTPGQLMAREAAEALGVFAQAAVQDVHLPEGPAPRAIYTIARGSSDAAANILSYVYMRALGIPVTSLPPSIFSIGDGVVLEGAAVLVISQSGASDDLVRTAKGAMKEGARVYSITNTPGSPVAAAAHLNVPIGAGPERAVPATKSVIGSIAAGLALLAALAPDTAQAAAADARTLATLDPVHPAADDLQAALLRARHVYVIGRDTGYGAAQEVALKLKECCAIHAEPYSASEVLHGPLQLATNPLLVLILDTGNALVQDSLDRAERRFADEGCEVYRIAPADIGVSDLGAAGAAALLLAVAYPIILRTALALGFDPDAPHTLSKVTQTT